MRNKFRAVGVAFSTCSVLLTGCGSLAIYPGADLPSSEIVALKGFYREYLIYSQQLEITAVDWQRPEKVWFVSEARFPPGRHSIGIQQTIAAAMGIGSTICVVDGNFEAGHTYKFASFSSSPDDHWYDVLPDQYKGSIGVEASTPGSDVQKMQLDTECSSRKTLCNQDEYCPHSGHPTLCKREPDFKYGLCEQQLQ